MKRNAVNSSNLAEVGYDPETKEMEIMFKGSGALYHYFGVPLETYEGMMKAESIGSYFNRNVKWMFRCERVKHG